MATRPARDWLHNYERRETLLRNFSIVGVCRLPDLCRSLPALFLKPLMI